MDKIFKKLDKKTKIIEGKNYTIANLSEEVMNGATRGWLFGHFYPKGSVFHRNDIEICYKIHPAGHEEVLHYHLCSFEFLLILSGKVEFEIDGNIHVLTAGMYYMLYPGNHERIVIVHEESAMIAVRLPSVPGNKIYVGEDKKNG